jgi:hypothetical protein
MLAASHAGAANGAEVDRLAATHRIAYAPGVVARCGRMNFAGATTSISLPTTATTGSSSSCYDNGNVAGAQQRYAITQSDGSGMNCALSFKMQQLYL